MDRIICLAGESGSGKTTIAELLEKEGYNHIQSYTTRKPRFEGEKGHVFVSEKVYKGIKWANNQIEMKNKKIIAETYFDNNYYFALSEQYQGKGNSIYVLDVAGIKALRERVKDAEIVVIYLKCDATERYSRMVNREFSEDWLDRHTKARERIYHDITAFTVVPCDYAVDANRPIEEVLKDVKGIIKMDK